MIKRDYVGTRKYPRKRESGLWGNKRINLIKQLTNECKSDKEIIDTFKERNIPMSHRELTKLRNVAKEREDDKWVR